MILEKAEKYASDILGKIQTNLLPFHNIYHTRAVVAFVKGASSIMTPENLKLTIIAAWFHDIGHIISYQDHEEASVQIARDFLQKEGMDLESIEIVSSCIRATRLPQKPVSLMEKTLCDADLYHLGSRDYFYWQLLLRREWEVSLQITYSDEEWHVLNRQFLADHKYHSAYGKETLSHQLKDNLAKIERLLYTYQSNP